MLEFQKLESATDMVTYYDLYSPPVIRGTQAIFVQYSKHPRLTTTSKRSLLVEIIENVNRAHQALICQSPPASHNSRKILWMQIANPSTIPLGYAPFYQARLVNFFLPDVNMVSNCRDFVLGKSALCFCLSIIGNI